MAAQPPSRYRRVDARGEVLGAPADEGGGQPEAEHERSGGEQTAAESRLEGVDEPGVVEPPGGPLEPPRRLQLLRLRLLRSGHPAVPALQQLAALWRRR